MCGGQEGSEAGRWVWGNAAPGKQRTGRAGWTGTVLEAIGCPQAWLGASGVPGRGGVQKAPARSECPWSTGSSGTETPCGGDKAAGDGGCGASPPPLAAARPRGRVSSGPGLRCRCPDRPLSGAPAGRSCGGQGRGQLPKAAAPKWGSGGWTGGAVPRERPAGAVLPGSGRKERAGPGRCGLREPHRNGDHGHGPPGCPRPAVASAARPRPPVYPDEAAPVPAGGAAAVAEDAPR